MPNPGPISQHLLSSIRDEVRRQGIVVWLDRDENYTGFVDDLRASSDAASGMHVAGFRGSHLELMLDLENHGGGIDKSPLLVHMPGFNEELVVATPIHELYKAGVRFRVALDKLVTDAAAGRVQPQNGSGCERST